jgi:diguanylate cyclase (GGDEF)-like protein
MSAAERVAQWSKPFWVVIGLALILGLGLLDIVTGYELSISLFYLIPIGLVAWYAGRRFALGASTISAIVWLIADIVSGQQYSNPLIFLWNAAIRFGFFAIVAWLLTALKTELEREKELSRSDYLTGAISPGFFQDLLQLEIDRCARYERPFTLAYLDIDDFKQINDRFGHVAGDEILRRVVTLARDRLRKSDLLARLGGDELAVILPETDQEAAPGVLADVQRALAAGVRESRRPVTFSIGAITFVKSPATGTEAVRMADELMYTAKKCGKNTIKYLVYTG